MAHALYHSIILVIFFFPLRIFAQINGNVSVGASIAATESSTPWVSPSGDFAFGFQQLKGNKDLFVLSIWFDKIPDKTIVWYEKGSDPVPRGSTIELDARDGLVLRDPGGRLVNSTRGLAVDVAYGFMNDTGNFVLFRSDSTRVWESFKNPADTIVPTQTIEIDGMLISRKTETQFSLGRFYALMGGDGSFVLNTRTVPSNIDFDDTYYNSQTSDSNESNSGYQLIFNERGFISVRRRNGQEQVLSPSSIPPASDNYYRATLNFDGVFTHYYHPKNLGDNSRWIDSKSWPDNICLSIDGGTGSGACGFNNVCRLVDQRPVCQCPLGYSLVDPNNTYGDCQPKFLPYCLEGEEGSAEDLYDISVVPDTDWPFSDYEQMMPSTEEACEKACRKDCFCAAAIYRSNSCWKKKLPLSNGRVDTTLGAKAFLKFRKGDVPLERPTLQSNPKRDRRTLIVVVSVLLGLSVFINFFFISGTCLGFFLVFKKKMPTLNQLHDTSRANSPLPCFAYKELEQATDGFKEELGRGSFGIVYKGVLRSGTKSAVAVKKLDRVGQDCEKEFRTEVNVIGQTHHKNLVRLLGFCDEGLHRLLVYEYMCNGTLASFLFGHVKPSWSLRSHIALGVAGGLAYLHEECVTQFIHCDIKPQNVLLDEYYNPRISDFGVAKLLKINQSHTLTNIRGTKGYVAPEWFRNTQITMKVDVYSFGVLLLEIISCRKNVKDLEFGDGEEAILTDWAWDCFQEGKLDLLVGDDLEALGDRERLERFAMVGIWCIQEDPLSRPTMRRVSQMLEGIVEVAVPISPFSFT